MEQKFLFIFMVLWISFPSLAVSLVGENIYKSKCMVCHGADGNGEPSMKKALFPPPPTFSGIYNKYPSGEDVKRQIVKILREGRLVEGKKSSAMSNFPELSEEEKGKVAQYIIDKFTKFK